MRSLWSYFRRKDIKHSKLADQRDEETERLKEAVNEFERAVLRKQREMENGLDHKSNS